MKTITRIFFASLFCVSFFQKSDAQITLTIGSETVCNAGDSITVPVNVTGFSAIGSFSIKILYNPAVLSFGRTLNWNSSFPAVIEGNNSTTGTLAESWILQTGPVTIADGKLFDIRFAAIGGSSSVAFSTNQGDVEVTNQYGVPYTITAISGGVAAQASPTPVITGTLSYCLGSNTTINTEAFASYLWSNNASTQSITATAGTYTVTVTDTNGCTGISANAIVVENDTDLFTQTLNECAGFSVTVGTNTYSTSGVYTDVLVNASGCDSTVITNLTINVNPVPVIYGDTTYCGSSGTTFSTGVYVSYNWQDADQGLGTSQQSNIIFSNDYPPIEVTVVDSNGCTGTSLPLYSSITSITPSAPDTQIFAECAPFSVTVGSFTHNTTGVYTDTLADVNGCDSIITTDLTIFPMSASSQTYTECAPFSVTVGTITHSTTGTYSDTLVAANGCDSIVTTNLTVNPTFTDSVTTSICIGDTLFFGTQTLTTAGTYTEVFSTINNCDSTVTVTLSVVTGFNENVTASICAGDTFILGTQNLTSSGVFSELFSSSGGCDSTVTLTLTVNNPTTSSQTFVECAPFSISVGTNTYSATGIFTDTLVNANGCDSIVTTDLTVNPASSVSQTFTECAPFSVTVGTNTYTATGVYNDTLVSANGCDSIVVTV